MTAMGTADEAGEAAMDLTTRRPEVIRRLLDRGIPPRTLQALFPEWELPREGTGPG